MSSLVLKLIAMITMLIDHTAAVFPTENYMIFRLIGRTAFPLFCFLLVEGFFHTKSRTKYLLNMVIFAFISEIPFDLAIFSEISAGHQNIFFTLSIGLISLILFEKISNEVKLYLKKAAFIFIPLLQILIILFAMIFGDILRTDYNMMGVLLIVMIYYSKKLSINFKTAPNIFAAIAVILWLLYYDYRFEMINESYGIFAAVLILFYNGKRGVYHFSKYFFYAFYPIHLAALYAIKLLIGDA